MTHGMVLYIVLHTYHHRCASTKAYVNLCVVAPSLMKVITSKWHALLVLRAVGLVECQTFGLLAQITTVFFAYFVIDGVVKDNAFELAAAMILDALVLSRVVFYMIFKRKNKIPGRIVLLSFITSFQLLVLVRPRCMRPGSPRHVSFAGARCFSDVGTHHEHNLCRIRAGFGFLDCAAIRVADAQSTGNRFPEERCATTIAFVPQPSALRHD